MGGSLRFYRCAGLLGGVVLGLCAPAGCVDYGDCGEDLCDIDDIGAAPESGAIDVPTNVRFWAGEFGSDPELVGPDGLVDMVVTHVGDNVVFTPRTPLQPLTVYRHGQLGLEFTTASGPDLVAPPLPSVEGWTSAYSSGGRAPCRETDARVTLDVVAGDLDTLVVVLDRAESSTLDPVTLDGEVTAIVKSFPGTPTRTLELGEAPCLDNWPGAKRGAETTVRLGAFDLAGNFSGWSEPEEVGIDGCDLGAGSGSPFAALVLLIRRRKKRRS